MKYAFIVFLLSFCFNVRAGDTLTRAEVYNFAMGDTFDYRTREIYTAMGHPEVNTDKITFSRYVISGIYWFPDSSVKYIMRDRIYPAPTETDTLKLDNPKGFEVILDTVFFKDPSFDEHYKIDSVPDYFGRRTNYITFFVSSPSFVEIFYTKDMGQVEKRSRGGVMGEQLYDTTSLIYYHGVNGTFGSPYTSFPTSINDLLPSDEKIRLFPTLNLGEFTVQVPTDIVLPVNLFIYNLQGQLMQHIEVVNATKQVTLRELSRGLYIWKASLSDSYSQTGRLIIE